MNFECVLNEIEAIGPFLKLGMPIQRFEKSAFFMDTKQMSSLQPTVIPEPGTFVMMLLALSSCVGFTIFRTRNTR